MSTCCLFCRKTGCHSNCACGSMFLPLFKTYLETIGINCEGPFEDFHCCQNCGTQLGKIVATLNKLRIELLQMHSVTLENLDATVGLIVQEDDILDKLRRQIVAQPDSFPARCQVSIVERPRPVDQILVLDNQTQTEVVDHHVEEEVHRVEEEVDEQAYPPLQLHIGDNTPDRDEESSLAPSPPKRPRRIKSKEPPAPEVKLPCRHQSSGCGEVLAASQMHKHERDCDYRPITCCWTNRFCKSNKKVAMSEFADHLRKYHNCHMTSSRTLAVKLKDGKIFVADKWNFLPEILEYDGHTFLLESYMKTDFAYFWLAVLGSKETADEYVLDFQLSKEVDDGKQIQTGWTVSAVPFHRFQKDWTFFVEIPLDTLKEFGTQEDGTENTCVLSFNTSYKILNA